MHVLPKTESVVLAVTTVLVLAVSLSAYSGNPIAIYFEVGYLGVVLGIGLFLSGRTMYELTKRIGNSLAMQEDAYAISLKTCRQKMAIVIGLYALLFLQCGVFQLLVTEKVANTVLIALWGSVSFTMTFVYSWVLRLMRPNPALMDVQVLERCLTTLDSISGTAALAGSQ